MVGPSRSYLWILARTPTLDDPLYDEILDRIRAQGYDLTPLRRTLQPSGEAFLGH